MLPLMNHNWEYKKLGEVCSVINGLWTGKKPPFIKVGVIRNTNFTRHCTLDESNIFYTDVEEKAYAKRKLQKGDIIIEKSGGSEKQPVGRPILFDLDGEFSFSNFTSTLRIKSDTLLPSFLHKALVGLYFQGKTRPLQSKTTGIHNLDFNTYLQFTIPVPPLAMQEQIVMELDRICEIIEKKKQQIKELNTLAQSLFYDMFGDPVTNNKGWDVKRLDEVGEIVTGSTPSTADSTNWDGTINWVTPAELNSQLYYGETQRKLTTKGAKGLTVMPCGTVLLSSRAPIGKLAISAQPMCCNQGFKNIVCQKSINNLFLYFYLLLTMDRIKEMGIGATFKEVSKRAISAYQTIVPPLPLQQSFAKKIEAIERQKELINQSIKETQTLFDSRMEHYFGN